jgi:Cys-rich four helix bundle protein (predicted Tat secretion target)
MKATTLAAATVMAAGSAVIWSDRAWGGAKAPTLTFDKADVLTKLRELASLTSECALAGRICTQHCAERLADGEKEFTRCEQASQQMTVVCEAITQLAAMKSIRIKEMLEACISSCRDCRDACEEHKMHWNHGMHLECKSCAEHCEKVIAASEALNKLLRTN